MSNRLHLPHRFQTHHLVGIVTAVLVLLLVGLRLTGLSSRLNQAAGNPAALRAAMSATPALLNESTDDPVVTDDMVENGLQARAYAHAATADGHPTEAEALLLSGLNDPASAYLTQFQLCDLYWNLGLHSQALQACQGTILSADYWLGEGFKALDDSRPTDALSLFELAAYTDPDMSEAWRHYGSALLAAGRSEEAVAALERVLFLTPSPTADVYRSLAQAYMEQDNLTMARDVLEQGLLSYPDQREYYTSMAESFLAEGDVKTADSWYVRMLQRWPYDAQVWSARGRIAQDEGRISDAVTFYQEAAANRPDGYGYWMNLAAAAATAGNGTLVRTAIDRAVELRPDDAGTWLEAGRYLTETDQPDAARAAFERVLELQPDNLEAANELAGLSGAVAP